MRHHLSELVLLTQYYTEDTSKWAVWLGRHPAEKVSVGPKGQLIRFRNPELSVRAKAGFSGFRKAINPFGKPWSSEPLSPP